MDTLLKHLWLKQLMRGWLGAVMELPHEDEELTGMIEGLRQGFTIYLADGIPAEGLPLAMEQLDMGALELMEVKTEDTPDTLLLGEIREVMAAIMDRVPRPPRRRQA